VTDFQFAVEDNMSSGRDHFSAASEKVHPARRIEVMKWFTEWIQHPSLLFSHSEEKSVTRNEIRLNGITSADTSHRIARYGSSNRCRPQN
jgi:hypothetical protein